MRSFVLVFSSATYLFYFDMQSSSLTVGRIKISSAPNPTKTLPKPIQNPRPILTRLLVFMVNFHKSNFLFNGEVGINQPQARMDTAAFESFARNSIQR